MVGVPAPARLGEQGREVGGPCHSGDKIFQRSLAGELPRVTLRQNQTPKEAHPASCLSVCAQMLLWRQNPAEAQMLSLGLGLGVTWLLSQAFPCHLTNIQGNMTLSLTTKEEFKQIH